MVFFSPTIELLLLTYQFYPNFPRFWGLGSIGNPGTEDT